MPTIKVDTDLINSYAAEMKEVLHRVRSIEAEYAATYSNLDWEIRAASNIEHRLTSIHNDLLSQIRGIEEFIQFFELAAREYDAVEKANKALDYSEGAGAAVATGAAAATGARFTTGSAAGTGEVFTTGSSINVGNAIPLSTNKDDKNSNSSSPDWVEGVIKAGSKLGFVGSLASAALLASHSEYDDRARHIINAGRIATWDFIANLGAIGDGELTAKEAFFGKWAKGYVGKICSNLYGENVVLNGKQIFKAVFKNELGKFSFKNAETLGAQMKVGAKWGSALFSLGCNYFDNLEEFKGTDNTGRMVAETITETTIDIVLGGVATAGAAVVLGTAAPAVAIGAAGAVAVWGLNTFTEWGTAQLLGEENKKDFTELVSDLALDGAELVGGAISAGWKKMFG